VIQHRIHCQTCQKSLKHGSVPPANPDNCVTSRMLRMHCKDFGCKFHSVAVTVELTETDRLRLGLREERAIA
jgi:hypothetical protein